MKGKKKTLQEVSIRQEAKGFTVSESYESGEPYGYESPKRFAYTTAEEASKHVSKCIAKLGEKDAY